MKRPKSHVSLTKIKHKSPEFSHLCEVNGSERFGQHLSVLRIHCYKTENKIHVASFFFFFFWSCYEPYEEGRTFVMKSKSGLDGEMEHLKMH